MDLKQKLNLIVEQTKHLKTLWVRDNPDDPDLAIYVHFFRGDELVVVAQTRMIRDHALEAAWIGSMGFSATEVSITMESYATNTTISTLTGQRWLHQEMQYVLETKQPGYEQVSECLCTLIADRNQQCLTQQAPYQIVDGEVDWHEFTPVTDTLGGVFYDTLLEAMAKPMLSDTVATTAQGPAVALLSELLGEEAARFHSDIAVQRALTERKVVTNVMMAATAGSVRHQLIAAEAKQP